MEFSQKFNFNSKRVNLNDLDFHKLKSNDYQPNFNFAKSEEGCVKKNNIQSTKEVDYNCESQNDFVCINEGSTNYGVNEEKDLGKDIIGQIEGLNQDRDECYNLIDHDLKHLFKNDLIQSPRKNSSIKILENLRNLNTEKPCSENIFTSKLNDLFDQNYNFNLLQTNLRDKFLEKNLMDDECLRNCNFELLNEKNLNNLNQETSESDISSLKNLIRLQNHDKIQMNRLSHEGNFSTNCANNNNYYYCLKTRETNSLDGKQISNRNLILDSQHSGKNLINLNNRDEGNNCIQSNNKLNKSFITDGSSTDSVDDINKFISKTFEANKITNTTKSSNLIDRNNSHLNLIEIKCTKTKPDKKVNMNKANENLKEDINERETFINLENVIDSEEKFQSKITHIPILITDIELEKNVEQLAFQIKGHNSDFSNCAIENEDVEQVGNPSKDADLSNNNCLSLDINPRILNTNLPIINYPKFEDNNFKQNITSDEIMNYDNEINNPTNYNHIISDVIKNNSNIFTNQTLENQNFIDSKYLEYPELSGQTEVDKKKENQINGTQYYFELKKNFTFQNFNSMNCQQNKSEQEYDIINNICNKNSVFADVHIHNINSTVNKGDEIINLLNHNSMNSKENYETRKSNLESSEFMKFKNIHKNNSNNFENRHKIVCNLLVNDNAHINHYDNYSYLNECENAIDPLEKFENNLKIENIIGKKKNKFQIFSDTKLHYIEHADSFQFFMPRNKTINNMFYNDIHSLIEDSYEKKAIKSEFDDALLYQIILRIAQQNYLNNNFSEEKQIISGIQFFII